MSYEGTFVVEVEPGVGIGAAKLGMSVAELVGALGEPENRFPEALIGGELLSWYASCLQVSFRPGGTIASIMVSRGAPIAMLHGMDLLRTPAAEVVTRLASLGDGSYDEHGSSYDIPGARLAFWRQGLPDEDWEPDDYDQYRDGLFWDTVSTWAEEPATEPVAADV